jgi:hemoglobin-like flavoprotein
MSHALKVVGALTQAVNNLDLIDSIIPVLKQLGIDHTRRGITQEHYQVLGHAASKTLEELLGCSWNNTVGQAWRIALNTVCNVMMKASEEADFTARNTTGRDDTMRPMLDE